MEALSLQLGQEVLSSLIKDLLNIVLGNLFKREVLSKSSYQTIFLETWERSALIVFNLALHGLAKLVDRIVAKALFCYLISKLRSNSMLNSIKRYLDGNVGGVVAFTGGPAYILGLTLGHAHDSLFKVFRKAMSIK